MQPQDILAWLRDNPAFFNTHAEELAEIFVPSNHNGQTISLTERQLAILRDKNRALESRMTELLHFGSENDVTSDRLHRLTVALMQATELSEISALLEQHIVEDFGIPHVVMRLWPLGAANLREYVQISENVVKIAQNLVSPYCGPYVTDEVLAWFGDVGPQLKSFSQFALRTNNDPFGMLVLASENSDRFYPDMGTLYLQRLSELLSAAVLRVLPVPPIIEEEIIASTPVEDEPHEDGM